MEHLTRCPLCDARVTQVGTVRGPRSRDSMPIVECAGCGSMFNRSPYREEESDLRDDADYLSRFFADSSSYYLDVIRTLSKIKPDLRSHLDVGCGVGALVSAGRQRGLQSQGLDLNPFAVDKAVARGLTVERRRLEDSDERYDLVTCDQVLEHIAAPREFLAALAAHVAPGGLLFLNVPYRPHPLLAPIYLRYPQAWNSPFFDVDVHINHFSHRAMTTVVGDILGMRSVVPFYGARNRPMRMIRWGVQRALASPCGYIYRR